MDNTLTPDVKLDAGRATSEQIASFASLFQGNPTAHYIRGVDGGYLAVDTGISTTDWERHLSGVNPSLLSIPIDEAGQSHFGILDVDRHDEQDQPVDWPATACRITELGLPLIIFKSKNGKGAWIALFLKEKFGFSTLAVRRLLDKYKAVLALDGEVEIFPKNEQLKQGQKGSGINIGYFGQERMAYGKEGELLDLDGFLALAHERQSFGQILESRDLTPVSASEMGQVDHKTDRPLPIDIIRELHGKNLASLRAAKTGARNDTLNVCCFFAARAFAAKALEGTEDEIKGDIREAGIASGMREHEINATGNSGWASGIKQPLKILDNEKAHDEAFARVTEWIKDAAASNPKFEDLYDDIAQITDEEYEPLRLLIAKRILIRPGALDGFRNKRRKTTDEPDVKLPGMSLAIEDVVPWLEPVDGADLIAELSAFFNKYIVFPQPADADTMAVWALASHCINQFDILPYLGVVAPSSECGKTTAMKLLSQFVSRVIRASNVSGATVYRAIELYRPTLMIDELDRLLADNKNTELIGILDAGHERMFANVLRCSGDDSEPRMFNCFGPKCYGMIGLPTRTVMSRSIMINLLRKRRDEHVEKLNFRWMTSEEKASMVRLQRQAARWTIDHLDILQSTRPNTLGLINRAEDNWESLLTIGEIAGDGWPSRIHKAASVPDGRMEEDELDVLLRDIRNVFHTRKVERIPSMMLLADLLRQDDSRWKRHGKFEKEMNLSVLSGLLSKLNVFSQPIRFNKQEDMFDKAQLRGYTLAQFNNLFDRQLAGVELTEINTGNSEEQPF